MIHNHSIQEKSINYSEEALIIIGHGSTTNPDSSKPTYLVTESIRQKNIFHEVHCCFWKEEPSIRDILYAVIADTIYIVPYFISEGYFTQTVIPRELEFYENRTYLSDKKVYYCSPVGSHSSMSTVLLKKAMSIAPHLSPRDSSLIIVGHGTKLNLNSAQAVQKQVTYFNQLKIFGEVLAMYMEEEPLISEWSKLTKYNNVIVIPFFISDGLHSYQDIPVLLGIREEIGPTASEVFVFPTTPYCIQKKTLYYGNAIGTDTSIDQVIFDQVEETKRWKIKLTNHTE